MFIAIEGSNGSGKGTLITSLKEELTKLGYNVVLTREPGGTKEGEALRKRVLSTDVSLDTELLFFSASRAINVIDIIKPALEDKSKNTIVITDRFDDSTRAFQHYARGMSLKKVEESIADSLNGIAPDLYIVLDLPAIEGLRRALNRKSEEKDNFEKESIDFLERARQGFLDIAKNDKENKRFVIDANLPKDVILDKSIEKIIKTIKERDNELK